MKLSLINIYKNNNYKTPRKLYFFYLIKKIYYKKNFINLIFINLLDMYLLGKNYKNLNYITNILVFNNFNIKEILICNAILELECSVKIISLIFNYTYLFLHSLLHLQGFIHMNRFTDENLFNFIELKFIRKLGFHYNPYIV